MIGFYMVCFMFGVKPIKKVSEEGYRSVSEFIRSLITELVFIEEIWYNKNYEKGIQSNKLRK